MAKPTVIVAGYAPETLSETFIRRQVEGLPGVIGTIRKSDIYLPGPKFSSLPAYPIQLARGWNNRMSAIQRCIDAAPDVVLCQYGPVGAILAPHLSRAKIPFVVHFHGYDAYRYKTLRRFKHSYQRMFESAAGIIGVSGDMTRQLVSLGAPSERLHCIPYGVELNACRADPANAPPRFLFVGRLVPKKAPETLIRAFAQAAASNPEMELIIIGDGPLRPRCDRLIEQLDISNQVTMLGSQPHEVVLREMSRARAYVQHSVRAEDGDCEGTPNSILEAAAAGLPIIATRHAGILDAVISGETGYLVDEHDVESMANHLSELSANPHCANELGAQGRLRVVAAHSLGDSLRELAKTLTGARARNPE